MPTFAGIDHIGLTVPSRDVLVEWEHELAEAGVTFTPIRDMALGHHLNFRDPDDIPLELYCPNAAMDSALEALRVRELTRLRSPPRSEDARPCRSQPRER